VGVNTVQERSVASCQPPMAIRHHRRTWIGLPCFFEKAFPILAVDRREPWLDGVACL
jgi:hypothetical protein